MPLTVLKRDLFYWGYFDAFWQPRINCAVPNGEFPFPCEQLFFPAGKNSTVCSGDKDHFRGKQGADRAEVSVGKRAIEGRTSHANGQIR